MQVQVLDKMGRYAIEIDGKPAQTPLGNPLESVNRALMEEVAEDIRRYGLDPDAGVSMYSLHTAYLDLGRTSLRGNLDSDVSRRWADDIFVHRSAFPSELTELWGEPGLTVDDFERGVGGLPLRSIMSVLLSGQRFSSPVLAYLMLVAHRRTLPLAMGNCGRLMEYLAEQEGVEAPAAAGRFWPKEVDEAFCAGHCLQNPRRADEDEAEFRARCPAFQAVDVLRRFASYPEEPEESLAV